MERLKRKKILITGGAGFIGSHLILRLLELNYNVSVIDINVEKSSFFKKEKIAKKVTFEIVDIRKNKEITKYIRSLSPDIVIHLAAEPIVSASFDNPIDTFATNIMGTAYILEACRNIKNLESVIVASSDKAYGKTTKKYYENSPLKGDHPYDVSKSCADLISQTYYITYNLPVVITRFGNVYGEGDVHFDRIIPGICKSIITNKILDIRSDGSYVRDYVYVKDVVNGYITLLRNLSKIHGEAFNFSSKETYSVLELIKKVEEILDIKIKYKIINNAKNEIPYQHLDDTKVKKLHWKNTYSLSQTIHGILDWYTSILQ